MSRARYLVLLVVFISLMFASSACDMIFPPPPLDLGSVPVYPGAERIDPSANSVAADRYRRDQKWIVSGHKAETHAYVLPTGTTSGQVKTFYASRLSQLGGGVGILMGNNDQIGDISPSRGPQEITIEFNATSESPAPILLIENYIVNGCAKGGAGCKPGSQLVHTCPPGMELKTLTSSRPNEDRNGTISFATDYCFGSDGKRIAPSNAYGPTPRAQ